MSVSPSAEKALQALEEGSRKSVDCQILLEDTFHTFSALERWETAESDVRSVQSIIAQVQEWGHEYYRTLIDSISVAVHLNLLSQDMANLAKSLLDPSHTPEEIQDFVADIRGYIAEALEKSKHISTAYRKIRKGINQVTDDIPGQMARLERRERRILEEQQALERRMGRAKVVKTVSTAALAVISGISIVTFPPMMLILPVGIPIAILVLEAYEHRSSKALMKSSWSARKGFKELEDITKCLAGLSRHVDLLIDFWLRSDTMLETISNGVARIKGNTPRLKLRLKATIEQWESVGELYADYTIKLKRIEKMECGATASLRSQKSISSF
ncbi:hypothetical protein C8F04DRAFT_1317554 [Mycena alexandri]|uniref:Uncharacterized protein n=1 Tax=Mycena alexandri TaxID=1745969 RepID=A0AAD6T6Z9_9AGAR|nr:hypothetical protein C8F04DRAFT_1317554 [Mycena alexandri]